MGWSYLLLWNSTTTHGPATMGEQKVVQHEQTRHTIRLAQCQLYVSIPMRLSTITIAPCVRDTKDACVRA